MTAFLEVPTGTVPVSTGLIGTLHDYVVHLTIRTTLSVLCEGSADVVFVPGPPSPTAKSAIVHVTLVSIGV